MGTVFVINEDGTKTEMSGEEFLNMLDGTGPKNTAGGLISGMEKEAAKYTDTIKPGKKVYSTGIRTKRANWPDFARLISRQFEHGGEKYALDNQEDKEFTDLVCEASPGKSGFDWVLQTIIKYCGRYIQFQREKDLLKIATYAYIAWLKSGGHLKSSHDEDTRRDGTATSPLPEQLTVEEPNKEPEEPEPIPIPPHEFEI
jgi:hypothetical protein